MAMARRPRNCVEGDTLMHEGVMIKEDGMRPRSVACRG
jgi:hypothetical protein